MTRSKGGGLTTLPTLAARTTVRCRGVRGVRGRGVQYERVVDAAARLSQRTAPPPWSAASNKRETQERLSAPTRVRAVPPPGSLSAMHGALEQGLNPTEVYLLVSQLAPTPARRESVGADEATRRAARRRASGALPLLTPSDARHR